MIRTAVIGAAGRMGRLLVAQVQADPELTLSAAVEVPGCPLLGQDAGTVAGSGETGIRIAECPEDALAGSDVVIDFSLPDSALAIAPKVVAAGVALVIGATPLTAGHRATLKALAERGGRILAAPNMSVGVNLLFALCARVTAILGDDYDIEVVEMHHNRKRDAPSGTAVRLAEVLAQASGRDYAKDVVHGRCGLPGPRPRREIGMHALRGGDVVGDHTVVFATDGERIELTHKASSRDTFVKGALRAAKFVVKAQPGLYDMQDVLGLR
jgi:4-hydroxy-tetrahydrodipicolinate reductase